MYESIKSVKLSTDKVIHTKHGIHFKKTSKNSYNLSFLLENNNFVLSSIIDFELIHLIYTLNTDIYEKVAMEKINDSESNVTIVMKKIMFDLFSQRYAYLHTTKHIENNNVIFTSKTITTDKPCDINDKLELLTIESIINKFEILSPHKLHFECHIKFNDFTHIPTLFDKIIGIIINKIFYRVKSFIESMK
jgi:hypothetical protein